MQIVFKPIGVIHSEFKSPEGTPLLDIKPYVPGFDNREKVRIGWLDRKIHRLKDTTDDGGFSL
ncbi:MAG: hypothetical protein U5O15_10970 [Candidatus Krumholzibacteriota bacterium]|nr:hypothetical protein [Candidatus Krumholzibacteriota bacterium]